MQHTSHDLNPKVATAGKTLNFFGVGAMWGSRIQHPQTPSSDRHQLAAAVEHAQHPDPIT